MSNQQQNGPQHLNNAVQIGNGTYYYIKCGKCHFPMEPKPVNKQIIEATGQPNPNYGRVFYACSGCNTFHWADILNSGIDIKEMSETANMRATIAMLTKTVSDLNARVLALESFLKNAKK